MVDPLRDIAFSYAVVSLAIAPSSTLSVVVKSTAEAEYVVLGTATAEAT